MSNGIEDTVGRQFEPYRNSLSNSPCPLGRARGCGG